MPISTGSQATAADVKAVTQGPWGRWVVDKLRDVDTVTGVYKFRIPSAYNGWNLVRAQGFVETPGTTNPTTVQVKNLTKYPSNDALSTAVSIASGSKVGTPGVVNTSYDDVSTDDEMEVRVTSNSTTKAKGLYVILEFKIP